MALTFSTQTPLGSPAKPFSLKSTSGKFYSLQDFSDCAGLLIVFMCNHCPYVIAVQDRLEAISKKYCSPNQDPSLGGHIGRHIGMIGINSNDFSDYPEDSFDSMVKRAKEIGYTFPYCIDETQEIARAYDAVCTPDPYLYARDSTSGVLKLAYRGRIDDSWKNPSKVQARDLENAIQCVLEDKPIASSQTPSMGCSIKWRS